ncbi:hypothetical protein Ddye_016248 [Dipteronia dyeriana]|uniref:Uncharacterized protein n=1 Tax=Dipteronia dyeriana TaxID=168575 RepID=A0AAD9U6X4_9ROSI|nr:hypothetical protein Ddye_016248 [Dipteronia dyeriana]
MDSALVVDIPLQGLSFTWTNNREYGSWARLDRFLYAPLFLSWFPFIHQRGLSRSVSDHNPDPNEDWGPRPFRTQNEWLENRELLEGVRQTWKNCRGGMSSGVSIARKSRAVKFFMKVWARGRRSSSDISKKLEVELDEIEKKAVAGGWSKNLWNDRKLCLVKIWENIRRDERKWRQSSRVKWIKDGDRNSRFFHIVASVRRKTNCIEEISVDGSRCRGPVQISTVERVMLEERFSMEEVWVALCDCDGDKAPGSDGLNLNFVKTN